MIKQKKSINTEENNIEELKKNGNSKRKIEAKLLDEANRKLKIALEKQSLPDFVDA